MQNGGFPDLVIPSAPGGAGLSSSSFSSSAAAIGVEVPPPAEEEKFHYVGIKRRRKLTEQAKERHRVCNRMGARRARAQARLDMEVMKAQNALLYLELSMTRAALYSVGQREFCARVAFDIEQAKGKLFCFYFSSRHCTDIMMSLHRCNDSIVCGTRKYFERKCS